MMEMIAKAIVDGQLQAIADDLHSKEEIQKFKEKVWTKAEKRFKELQLQDELSKQVLGDKK